MGRPLKDDETHRPSVPLTLKLTEPRMGRLAEIAARWGTSRSRVVERLIQGATDEYVEKVAKKEMGR